MHSLLVDVHGVGARYREIINFDDAASLPVFVLAYKRVVPE
jgi:hypothetical protein